MVIDADLQDPPELIPAWSSNGGPAMTWSMPRAAHAKAKAASSDSPRRRSIAAWSGCPIPRIPRDTGDFRLLSRRALDALGQLRERQRFMKGLFSWIGYRQTAVHYLREPRQAGTTKWNYWRLGQLAIEGITSFSTAPLRLATWVGLAPPDWPSSTASWCWSRRCFRATRRAAIPP